MSFHTWCGTFPVAVTKTPNKSNLREEGFPWLTAQGHSPSGWGKHGGRNVRLLTLHSQLEVNAGAQLTFSVFSVTQQHPWDDAVTHFRVSLLPQLTRSRNFLIDMPEASLLNDSRARQVGKINHHTWPSSVYSGPGGAFLLWGSMIGHGKLHASTQQLALTSP